MKQTKYTYLIKKRNKHKKKISTEIINQVNKNKL